jgi:hypothetical protein
MIIDVVIIVDITTTTIRTITIITIITISITIIGRRVRIPPYQAPEGGRAPPLGRLVVRGAPPHAQRQGIQPGDKGQRCSVDRQKEVPDVLPTATAGCFSEVAATEEPTGCRGNAYSEPWEIPEPFASGVLIYLHRCHLVTRNASGFRTHLCSLGVKLRARVVVGDEIGRCRHQEAEDCHTEASAGALEQRRVTGFADHVAAVSQTRQPGDLSSSTYSRVSLIWHPNDTVVYTSFMPE